jgi:HSP20 family molecular chaperone IbpA
MIMAKNPTNAAPTTATSTAPEQGRDGGAGERVAVTPREGTERTRERPVYAPRVDIVETEDALELYADMPGVTKDSVEVTLEQRVLSIRGQSAANLPEGGLAPIYLEYEPGDYERAFTLSDAVDPTGIEARVRAGVLYLRLPKAGPAKRQRIEVRAD